MLEEGGWQVAALGATRSAHLAKVGSKGAT